MTDPLLRATGLTLTRGPARILDNVDLRLHLGETVVLLGPNGAGKSSLLATLAGLTSPTAGTVAIRGRVATALQSPALADRTARANVELALAWWGVPRGDRPARAQAALELTGAGQLADRPTRELSGGEARRVHLARSIAVEPDVLLLDEPFAGLDQGTRADLLDDSVSALRSPRRATLIVVHDRAEAWALADRVVILMAGRIVADAATQEVLEHPGTEAVADFVGFTGRIDQGSSILRLRTSDVVLSDTGDVRGTVRRRVPVEEGVRCDLEVADGQVAVLVQNPGPRLGDTVRVTLRGGITYPVAESG